MLDSEWRGSRLGSHAALPASPVVERGERKAADAHADSERIVRLQRIRAAVARFDSLLPQAGAHAIAVKSITANGFQKS